MRRIGRFDDDVLGEEPGCTDQRAGNADAGQRDRADDHHPVSHRDLLAQSAHAPHVLLVGHCVDHGARTKEQQCLEERVCEQMEDRTAIGSDPQRHEHVTQL